MSRGSLLQFSLRKLLLFTLMASIISTTVGLPYAEYRRESAIAKKLEARCCWVDWRPRTRNWGADFFSRVGLGHAYWRISSVEYEEGWNVKNEDLAELSELNYLSWVSFPDSSVDDRGLLHLNGCASLAHLDMHDSDLITDNGLRNLKLTNLRSLNIDGTNVTYDGLRWIAKQNPLLDEPTLIGRLALAQLEQCQFRCSTHIATKSKLRPIDRIQTGTNSRREWRDAAEHLREFPGLVIAQFRDLPEHVGPEVDLGLTVNVVNVEDGKEILPHDVQVNPRKNTKSAVAVVPPRGTAVSRLIGGATIRAWFGDPDWPVNVGTKSLQIPDSTEIVFVDSTCLPVTVELRPVDE